MDWSLATLTMIQLFAIRGHIKQLFAIREHIKIEEPPELTGVSEALRAIRHALDNWHEPAKGKDKLTLRLQNATKDGYNRTPSKTSRYQPKYKDKPSATKPIVQKATKKQKQAFCDWQQAA